MRGGAECTSGNNENVLKNRHGETGRDYLAWLGEYTSFRDSDQRYRDHGQ